ETPIVGAAALHAVLKSWLSADQGRSADILVQETTPS
ncbi:MAG: hypothetical protein K0S78_3526, partial [Thermomicrobiales bacterium]|nr:hypothetical protein [Thermomicrobiales bacterium]